MKRIYRAGIFALILITIYFVGMVSGSFISNDGSQVPFSFSGAAEKASPGDWIKESQVRVLKDKVVINLKGATWAKFSNTNSMDPVIDEFSNSIEVKPDEKSLQVGDIISYQSSIYDVIVIHRIVDIREDDSGVYFVVKGDNNMIRDEEKVRFNQIQGVVVGVLY